MASFRIHLLNWAVKGDFTLWSSTKWGSCDLAPFPISGLPFESNLKIDQRPHAGVRLPATIWHAHSARRVPLGILYREIGDFIGVLLISRCRNCSTMFSSEETITTTRSSFTARYRRRKVEYVGFGSYISAANVSTNREQTSNSSWNYSDDISCFSRTDGYQSCYAVSRLIALNFALKIANRCNTDFEALESH